MYSGELMVFLTRFSSLSACCTCTTASQFDCFQIWDLFSAWEAAMLFFLGVLAVCGLTVFADTVRTTVKVSVCHDVT